MKVYDAHACTSELAMSASARRQPGECVSAASCRAAPMVQPSIYGSPSSATFSGAGNVSPGRRREKKTGGEGEALDTSAEARTSVAGCKKPNGPVAAKGV